MKAGENLWSFLRRAGITDAREVAAFRRKHGSPRAGGVYSINKSKLAREAHRGGGAFFASQGMSATGIEGGPQMSINAQGSIVTGGATGTATQDTKPPDAPDTPAAQRPTTAQQSGFMQAATGIPSEVPAQPGTRPTVAQQSGFMAASTGSTFTPSVRPSVRQQSGFMNARLGIGAPAGRGRGVSGNQGVVNPLGISSMSSSQQGTQPRTNVVAQQAAVNAAKPPPWQQKVPEGVDPNLYMQSTRMSMLAIQEGWAPDTLTDLMGEIMGKSPEEWRAFLTVAGYTETEPGVWRLLPDAPGATGGGGYSSGWAFRPMSYRRGNISSRRRRSVGSRRNNTFQGGNVDTLMSWRIKLA
jgi:hypothetical protein